MRNTIKAFAVCAMAVSVSACLGPTYGTDKTAGEQLMEDLGSAIALGRPEQTKINYAPRPDLVQPPTTATLPTPQQSVVEQEGAWPESPEQRRARIRAEIDEGGRDARFVGGADAVAAVGASEGPARTGPPGARRIYLTDPPSEYRQPAPGAATDVLGESEAAKQRRLRRASGERTGLRRLIPWL
ncbi:MAG: hypothetical protein AAGI92_09580 [Pseudomonadota bacterium]